MQFKYILKGTRPKTLIAGIVPCFMAFSLSLILNLKSNHIALLCCLCLAVCIQIARPFD